MTRKKLLTHFYDNRGQSVSYLQPSRIKLVGISMLLCATSGFVFAKDNQASAEQLYQAAVALYQVDKKETVEVFQAFVKAANAGSADAHYQLAKAYYFGAFGQKKDEKKALSYLDKAMQLGSDQATLMRAEIWLKTETMEGREKAIQLLEPLVKEQHLGAVHLLAVTYLDPKNSTEEQLHTGIALLTQNEKSGYIPTVETVAWMLEYGHIFKQDLAAAQQYYELLAQKIPTMQKSVERVKLKRQQETKSES